MQDEASFANGKVRVTIHEDGSVTITKSKTKVVVSITDDGKVTTETKPP